MNASDSRILALDLGTSSVRAVVCDGAANPIPNALARREVEPHQGDDGKAEVDADAYVDGLIGCLDELHAAGALAGVSLVATASQWHSVLAVDADDPAAARSAVLPWLDTRAQPQPGREPADATDFHVRTGSWLHSLYWTAKIPWLRARLGGGRVRFVGLPDFVRGVLLDDDATSVSLASGAGMLNLVACDWDAEAMELAGVTANELPRLSEEPGRLAPRWRDRWPALAEAAWHPVLGDGAASNLGSGCSDSSTVAVTVGTSAALRVVHTDEPAPVHPEVWRYRVDKDHQISGIAMSGGGVLNAWVKDLLGLETTPDPRLRPGTHGLISVPLHAGSRPPFNIVPGSGAVHGLSLRTSGEELRAATLEGVCLETARALEVLESSLGQQFAVVLGGGAAYASPWWQQTFAATFGRAVAVADDPEVGARGAAALALGLRLPAPGPSVQPDREDTETMAARKPEYVKVRDFLIGLSSS